MKTILVVDDDKVFLDAIKELLEKTGYNVLTALNYEQIMKMLKNHSISLMLLDIMMPDLDGTNLLLLIKESVAFLKDPFPIVYISAKPKENVDLSGSDGFIQKPYNNNELIENIEKILKK